MDIAKGLLDKGYMAPTVYFPLIVPECMMVAPIHTANKESIIPAAKNDVAKRLFDLMKRSKPPTSGRSDQAMGKSIFGPGPTVSTSVHSMHLADSHLP